MEALPRTKHECELIEVVPINAGGVSRVSTMVILLRYLFGLFYDHWVQATA